MNKFIRLNKSSPSRQLHIDCVLYNKTYFNTYAHIKVNILRGSFFQFLRFSKRMIV